MELTLRQFSKQPIVSQTGENFSDMSYVCFFRVTEDEEVIQVYNNVYSDDVSEDDIDERLEMGWCVC